jgi:hypothetical protein
MPRKSTSRFATETTEGTKIRIFLSVFSVLSVVNPPLAHATALIVCSGADGVVVSADSRGRSLKGELQDYDKLQLVGTRVVVAEAGLLVVHSRRGTIFDVHDFVTAATGRLGPEADAAKVARALFKAARRQLGALSSHPSVMHAERPQIIFLVAGFDQRPVLFRVLVELQPFAVSETALSESLSAVGLGPGHLDRESTLFARVEKLRPGSAARLFAEQPRLEERADICGLVLTVEAELNPTVAPPIRQALLRPSGAAQKRVYHTPPN